MLRRSHRLSEAKGAAHHNGGPVSKKKAKLNENDVMSHDNVEKAVICNSSARVIVLKYIPFNKVFFSICFNSNILYLNKEEFEQHDGRCEL